MTLYTIKPLEWKPIKDGISAARSTKNKTVAEDRANKPKQCTPAWWRESKTFKPPPLTPVTRNKKNEEA